VARRDDVPVHDVQPRLDVVRATVLVVEVVRVLPHVDAEQGVRPSEIGQSWLVVVTISTRVPSCTSHAQPEPNVLIAAASIVSLKRSMVRNVSRIARASLPSGSPPPSGDMLSQKMAVVEVTAEVVRDRAADVRGQFAEARQELRRFDVGPLRPVERHVGLVDVRLVVLVMMKAHRLGRDVRLERLVGVRQVGHGVGHLSSPPSKAGRSAPQRTSAATLYLTLNRRTGRADAIS